MTTTEKYIRIIGLGLVIFSAIYGAVYVKDNEFRNSVKDNKKTAPVQAAIGDKDGDFAAVQSTIFYNY